MSCILNKVYITLSEYPALRFLLALAEELALYIMYLSVYIFYLHRVGLAEITRNVIILLISLKYRSENFPERIHGGEVELSDTCTNFS